MCFVLGNFLSDWRCGEFKTGKSSNNYSAWKELGGDPVEASSQLQSGWQDTASLYKPGFAYTHRLSQLQQHEYCSFYQGASSSFHVNVGTPFLGDRKPGNIQKPLINNSLSTSVKTCTFRNPAGVGVTDARTWAHAGVTLFTVSVFRTQMSACKCVLLCGKREQGDIHTSFFWVPKGCLLLRNVPL